ncbi:MAG: carboxymuconolactone decarboxylase family protein [Geodermatophilaceae bacterium]
MTRLPYADPTQLAPDIAGALSALPDLHLFGVVGHAETAFMPWLGLGGALLSSLSLDPALRELVILQVAASTGSDYERVQHDAIATSVGVSVEAVEAVVTGTLDAPELAESSPVLRVVDELVRTHTTSEAGMSTLRSRLGDRASVEVLLVVGYYLGVAVLADAVDLDPDPPAQMAVIVAAGGNTEEKS